MHNKLHSFIIVRKKMVLRAVVVPLMAWLAGRQAGRLRSFETSFAAFVLKIKIKHQSAGRGEFLVIASKGAK